MTTKLIAAVIIIAVLYGGWNFFLYWEKVKNEEETQKKQNAAAQVVGENLPGMPYNLNQSLKEAQSQGAAALRNWLKTYGSALQDPRKAWIELDYCVAVAREDPAEARRVFQKVRERTGPSSPVWPRLKQLEPTYQ
jgi:hypothetical protein